MKAKLTVWVVDLRDGSTETRDTLFDSMEKCQLMIDGLLEQTPTVYYYLSLYCTHTTLI